MKEQPKKDPTPLNIKELEKMAQAIFTAEEWEDARHWGLPPEPLLEEDYNHASDYDLEPYSYSDWLGNAHYDYAVKEKGLNFDNDPDLGASWRPPFPDQENFNNWVKEKNRKYLIATLDTTPCKTTFYIDEMVMGDFIEVCNHIGFRRDRYLNKILPAAITLFAKSPKKNSPHAEVISRAVRETKKPQNAKYVFNLSTVVIEAMNFVCNEKQVPRDVFFEEVLRCLVHGSGIGEKTGDGGEDTLLALAGSLYDPWFGWMSTDSINTMVSSELPAYDEKTGEWDGGYSPKEGPQHNHSPFDSVLLGDLPMDKVLEAMASKNKTVVQDPDDTLAVPEATDDDQHGVKES